LEGKVIWEKKKNESREKRKVNLSFEGEKTKKKKNQTPCHSRDRHIKGKAMEKKKKKKKEEGRKERKHKGAGTTGFISPRIVTGGLMVGGEARMKECVGKKNWPRAEDREEPKRQLFSCGSLGGTDLAGRGKRGAGSSEGGKVIELDWGGPADTRFRITC